MHRRLGRPPRRSGPSGKENLFFLPLSGYEPQFPSCPARSLVNILRHPGTFLLLFYLLRSVVCSWIGTVVLQSWYTCYGLSYHTCIRTYPNNKKEGGSWEEFSPRRLPNSEFINPLNPELNPICYLLALLGAHHFLHVSRIGVKLLTFRLLMSYICGAPILDVSRSHTTTQHSR